MIFRFFRDLRRLGRSVLGVNARNLAHIYPLNPRGNLARADDKLLCKSLLEEAGIPHPATLAVYRRHRDLQALAGDLQQRDAFVIKPARGYGGRGIAVVRREADGLWVTSGSRRLRLEDLRSHVCRILAGEFTLENVSDAAFVEEFVVAEEALGTLASQGLADIRIIVRQGRPIMAMLRLPTRLSSGRANLHQGAVGVGVELQTGVTTHGVLRNRPVSSLPDTGRPLSGIRVPCWSEIVEMAVRAAGLFGLGFLGVDIVIDRTRGPLVMEVNARPGLAIQLANAAGLAGRLS